MTFLSSLLLPLSFLCALPSCSFFTSKTSSVDQDLYFIYQQIIDNHPGIYNAEDPLFKEHLETEYKKASELLIKSPNIEDQKQIIKVFAQSFNDKHLWVYWFDHNKQIPTAGYQFVSRQLANNGIWISLPTFNINSANKEQFENVLKKVPFLKEKSLIIFDLRGNSGGNDEYGKQVVDKVFGNTYAEHHRANAEANIAVDWRASTDNIAYIKNLWKDLPPRSAEEVKTIAEGMSHSLEAHEVYYHEVPQNKSIQQNKLTSYDVKTKIVVIIDQSNVSAALDFIDDLKAMNYPLILVGKTTKADRLYMEVRQVDLPSRLGTFSFPIKVYRNRARGDNVPYTPDYECNFDMSDSKQLEQFILNLVYGLQL